MHGMTKQETVIRNRRRKNLYRICTTSFNQRFPKQIDGILLQKAQVFVIICPDGVAAPDRIVCRRMSGYSKTEKSTERRARTK